MGLELNHVDMKLGDRVPELRQCALLLDIDGTILDLAPAPQEVWVPAELRNTLSRLEDLTGGALALVSGRSLHDIDLIFSPLQLPAVGGHGAELRVTPGGEAVTRALELNPLLKRKLATLTELGPGILVTDGPLPVTTGIHIAIRRGGEVRFEDRTTLEAMKRKPEELVEYLFRENTFPNGSFLLTGTGLVPSHEFTLASGDEIAITIDGIGTLRNPVG